MKHSHLRGWLRGRRLGLGIGQAAVEFALIAGLMLLLVCMVIDLCRAIHDEQLIAGLSRQGSNLASRGTTLPQAAAAVIGGSAALDLNDNGQVIITSVTNINRVYTITDQFSRGKVSASSRIGTGIGNPANMPASAKSALQPGQTMYITEIFFSYKPITPIKNLVKFAMPSTLYQAAYF
ncbi:MAG TPA: TadE/TadG family type IV pilus assembly protein [Candidatus Binataceae bacterium]|nr:TadE/TadG family type IV pilus assembly protein [Candidatus Binataceae bacterium]